VVVAEMPSVRAPSVSGRFRVTFLRQLSQELLDPVLGRAGMSARMQSRQSCADCMIRAMEPHAHPFAARARPSVENRDMA
jgi:hypothetical protein